MSDPAGPSMPPPVPPQPSYGQPSYGQPSYGQPSYGQPWPQPGYPMVPQRPSQAMAITALVLSFVFFVPLALLVAVGLAIAVLVRSRHGINHGRGKAITALVLSLLFLAGWVVLIVVAVNSAGDAQRDSSGQVTQAGTVAVQRLRLGDCFDQSGAPRGDSTASVSTVHVVPCSQSHDWEVFHTFELGGGSTYPGTDQVSRFAEGGCLDAYRPFTGAPHDASGPEVFYIYPRANNWRFGDRTVQCVIGREGGSFTGSLRGSEKSAHKAGKSPGLAS